jgi:hypothetical protein
LTGTAAEEEHEELTLQGPPHAASSHR